MMHSEITEKIIRAFYKVRNTLGHGFLEKVYENALAIELRKNGCSVEQQKRLEVFYDGQSVGEFYADMMVDDVVVLEFKAVKNMLPEHQAQLLNYLKASNREVGMVLNFGKNAEFKRMVFTQITK